MKLAECDAKRSLPVARVPLSAHAERLELHLFRRSPLVHLHERPSRSHQSAHEEHSPQQRVHEGRRSQRAV
jgi:hypothetical protein